MPSRCARRRVIVVEVRMAKCAAPGGHRGRCCTVHTRRTFTQSLPGGAALTETHEHATCTQPKPLGNRIVSPLISCVHETIKTRSAHGEFRQPPHSREV